MLKGAIDMVENEVSTIAKTLIEKLETAELLALMRAVKRDPNSLYRELVLNQQAN